MENMQYLTDEAGKKTAVLLPIEDWKSIQREFDYGVPDWHKDLVLSRSEELKEPGMTWEVLKTNLKRKV